MRRSSVQVRYPALFSERTDAYDVDTIAEQAVSKEEAEKLEKKFRENSFTFDDYLDQLENLKKMGGIKNILGMLPGMKALKNADIDEKQLQKNKAIIQSMTAKERLNPETIKSSNRQRIAKGSGTTIQEDNQLIKQFEQTKELMKQMKNRKGFGKMPFNIG